MNIPQVDNNLERYPENQPDFIYHKDDYAGQILTASPNFIVEKIKLNGICRINPGQERFYIIMNLSGELELQTEEKLSLAKGETSLLPANLNEIKIIGKGEFLKIYLPLNKEEILNKLQNLNFNEKQISYLPGLKDF
jgi:mannose-6-phosphate isomerase class I